MYYTGSNAFATLRQGLVGAWCPSLPNGGSGNTLPDVSGYNNHGSLVNMSPDDWVSAQYGRVLDFDGSDDRVDFGNTPTLNCPNAMTISMWARRKGDAVNTYHAWLQRFAAGVTGYQLYVNNSDNIVRFYTNTIVASTYAMSDTNWHHILVTNDGSVTKFFVDGIGYGSSSQSLVNAPTSVVHNFGAYSSFYANGQMGDMRIYNRALTESEIKLLASRPGIGLRQESHRNTFYQFPSFQPVLARRSSAIIGGGIT